jgi:hypothetical protein
MSDLVLMDKTYADKIALRRDLVSTRQKDVVGLHPVASEAVQELYSWLFETYLPVRYPTMFQIEPNDDKGGGGPSRRVKNLVTNDTVPLDPPDPKECLKTIGRHVDCEFGILLPTANSYATPFRAVPTTEPKEVFHLHAFVLAFPSGFTPAQKMGLPLAGMFYGCCGLSRLLFDQF